MNFFLFNNQLSYRKQRKSIKKLITLHKNFFFFLSRLDMFIEKKRREDKYFDPSFSFFRGENAEEKLRREYDVCVLARDDRFLRFRFSSSVVSRLEYYLSLSLSLSLLLEL